MTPDQQGPAGSSTCAARGSAGAPAPGPGPASGNATTPGSGPSGEAATRNVGPASGHHPRLALGVAYRGQAYRGWQRQSVEPTVQGHLEAALSEFAAVPVETLCAGRTDTGVHGLNQVVHIDPPVARELNSWVRGTNRYLPDDIAVQWCREVGPDFHARYSALGRRYTYLLLESPVRPAIESTAAGWVFTPLDGDRMREAAAVLIGEHDFSAFRSSECQAKSPVRTLHRIDVRRVGAYWRFDFDGNAFLHHMIRNIMGCLIAVGSGRRPVAWMGEVLAARLRLHAAPTFSPAGLYFTGPYYDGGLGLPDRTPAMDWLPG